MKKVVFEPNFWHKNAKKVISKGGAHGFSFWGGSKNGIFREIPVKLLKKSVFLKNIDFWPIFIDFWPYFWPIGGGGSFLSIFGPIFWMFHVLWNGLKKGIFWTFPVKFDLWAFVRTHFLSIFLHFFDIF